MQPYFFPYLGYFSLIHHSELWIVFDITQYTRKSWLNRNKLLHPTKGWQYISVPLERSSIHLQISDVAVQNKEKVRKCLLGKISPYKKSAPYYSEVLSIVNKTFENCHSSSLVDLNVSSIQQVCDYLDIQFNYQTCSKLNLEFPSRMKAGDWAPFICQALGATSYVNPIGGRFLFDEQEFIARNIELNFLDFNARSYFQEEKMSTEVFSVLDALLWNSKSEVLGMIENESKFIQ